MRWITSERYRGKFRPRAHLVRTLLCTIQLVESSKEAIALLTEGSDLDGTGVDDERHIRAKAPLLPRGTKQHAERHRGSAIGAGDSQKLGTIRQVSQLLNAKTKIVPGRVGVGGNLW